MSDKDPEERHHRHSSSRHHEGGRSSSRRRPESDGGREPPYPDEKKDRERTKTHRSGGGDGASREDGSGGKAERRPAPRHFKNDAKLTRRDPRKQLIASLSRLLKNDPPQTMQPGGGLYYGPVSVAYLFFVLQRIYGDEIEVEGQLLGVWSAAYLKKAEEHMKAYPGPEKQKCGVSDDIMAMVAIDAASTKDTELVKELCDFADVVTELEAVNEWLYGRAGYLYLLRFVKVCFPDDPDIKALIDETADEVIDEIMESPKPWKWHGKAYGKGTTKCKNRING